MDHQLVRPRPAQFRLGAQPAARVPVGSPEPQAAPTGAGEPLRRAQFRLRPRPTVAVADGQPCMIGRCGQRPPLPRAFVVLGLVRGGQLQRRLLGVQIGRPTSVYGQEHVQPARPGHRQPPVAQDPRAGEDLPAAAEEHRITVGGDPDPQVGQVGEVLRPVLGDGAHREHDIGSVLHATQPLGQRCHLRIRQGRQVVAVPMHDDHAGIGPHPRGHGRFRIDTHPHMRRGPLGGDDDRCPDRAHPYGHDLPRLPIRWLLRPGADGGLALRLPAPVGQWLLERDVLAPAVLPLHPYRGAAVPVRDLARGGTAERRPNPHPLLGDP